jgi:hypothetical protein
MDLGADGSVKLKFEYGFHVYCPCLAGAGYDTRLKTWLSPERLSETACKQTQSGEADIPRRPLLTQSGHRWILARNGLVANDPEQTCEA